MQPPKSGDGGGNQDPQKHDLGQRESAQVPHEEQPCPKRIEEKLDAEEHESSGCAAEAMFAPDEPSRHGDQDVEYRPNRTEEPRRRGPGRLRKTAVEGASVRGSNGPDAASHEDSSEPSDKAEYLPLKGQMGTFFSFKVYPGLGQLFRPFLQTGSSPPLRALISWMTPPC